ncbi:MAG TPA: SPOR domain-containing protein [Roseiarcus sp.]
MSVSGSRGADDINLEEFERRLRAAGAQQANVEDPLVELARLVESSYVGSSSEAPARVAAETDKRSAESIRSIETGALRPTIDETEDLIPAASEADRAARQDYEFDAPRSYDPQEAGQAADRRPGRWKLAVSALALAGLAMIGAVFALKGRVPGLPKDPPFIAAAQGPTKVQPPSDETVTASNDPGVSVLKDNAKPATVKIVNSEEQPVDLGTQAPPENPPAASVSSAGAGDAPNPPAASSNPTPVAATINTPLVPQPAAPPPTMTSEFPDPKPVRTVSLRPDGTPIGAVNQPIQSPGDAAPAAAPTKPAVAPPSAATPAPKTISDAAAVAEPSTPKLELPTKLSPKSSARIAVAKTDATAPEANAQPPGEPAQPGAQVKPADKTAKKPKLEKNVAEATGTAATPDAPPVDATPATASGGWAVQLAAPKSEAEAQSKLAQLTSKYGSQLNGSPIGVHKAQVNGETIYRLRVVGLTKADAAALCARLKGEGGECFIAK